ncbi:iron-sulfur cluster repair di-iron protein [Aureivirga sp. CE67]|uniref:iron-sulfur cluster repair di-iron protein n=1 Tax=Aureivirga sp. CE67 TaxID=1788983 RepID=UPI0018CA4839|nr:iron-sulfur cluster repair di-iron protein [Aureivirga sp. CE67]
MEFTKEKTVASYVNENIANAHVFKKFGIDFCCGGGISVERACAKHNLQLSEVLDALEKVNSPITEEKDFNNWELDTLLDYIVDNHHSYVEETIPVIKAYANRVAEVHGHHYTEVIQINELFEEVAGELAMHLKKEELVLFPFVKKLLTAKRQNQKIEFPHFGTVNNPVRMMEYEHENAGDVFKEIAKLTNNYTPPEGACNTFKALYALLGEFESDLHTHIHLENNILHPKAISLEEEVLG